MPENLVFPAQDVFRFCRNVSVVRDRVAQELQVPVGGWQFLAACGVDGKGADCMLRRSVRNLASRSGELSYSQPVHLSDVWRQQLYELAYGLLNLLNAPPATYLMQFGFVGEKDLFRSTFGLFRLHLRSLLSAFKCRIYFFVIGIA